MDPNDWTLTGNAKTDPTANFLGTTDDTAMTDTCAHLAQRLKLLQNLFQHVTDPDRQAEIGDQIAEVEQQMRDNGCNDRFTTSVGPGSGSSADNTVVLARSAEGRILYNWWPLGGSGPWAELPGGGRTDAAPAAALVGPDHNYLFAVVKGLDGNVYLNQGTLGGAFVGWQQMGFQTAVAVGAGSSGDNTVLVAKDADGRIFYNWWPLGGSGPWAELPGGGRTDAAPAAALVGPDHNYLFAVVKGLDGNVYLNQGTLGGAFVGWQQMGFQTAVAVGAGSSGDNTVLVAKDADGRIFYNWWPLGGSGPWAELPGGGRTDAAPAAALVGPDHNYLFAVVKGLDGNVYLNQGTLGGAFVGWQQMNS